jgi:hypothetical protein
MHFVFLAIQSHQQISNPRLSPRIPGARCLTLLTAKAKHTFLVGNTANYLLHLTQCYVATRSRICALQGTHYNAGRADVMAYP